MDKGFLMCMKKNADISKVPAPCFDSLMRLIQTGLAAMKYVIIFKNFSRYLSFIGDGPLLHTFLEWDKPHYCYILISVFNSIFIHMSSLKHAMKN
jgi:hypothetical protein